MRLKIGILLLSLLSVACSKSENEELDGFVRESGNPVDGIRIAWDYSSLQQLAPRAGRMLSYAGYPRVRRMRDGCLMAVYEAEGNGELIQSKDNGLTWTIPVVTFKKHQDANYKGELTDVNISNTEIIQLQNGDIVLACNYRPAKEEIAPFAIAIKRSKDNGKTWLDDQVLYEALPRFKDGCWEPSLLQLPDGELQVYFANEAPYIYSDEQQISMLSSPDNGETWSKKFKTVCFRAGRRDGMPAPLLSDNEILVAIEDNKIGEFKPYIVRSKVSENWGELVSGESINREYVLKEPLPDNIYAGAPYLMRIPSGEVLLSYQTTKNRTSNWELSTMEVAIGTKQGRSFDRITQPFQIPDSKQAKWSSISLWDDKTIVAASATDVQTSNIGASRILGHIIPELKAYPEQVAVQENDYQLFIGHQSTTNLIATVGTDQNNLYVSVRVRDEFLYTNPGDIFQGDGVNLYIDAGNYNLIVPDNGLFKIWSNYQGQKQIFEGDRGSWKKIETGNTQVEAKKINDGYQLQFKIPFSDLNKQDHLPVRINLELSAYLNANTYYKECIANSNNSASNTWLKLSLE